MKKEISFEEAIKLHREGKNVSYRFTLNNNYKNLSDMKFSIFLDVPKEYTFFVEELRANPDKLKSKHLNT